MLSKRRFFALSKKESLQILKDPSSLLIAFVMPLVLLFLMGYAISLDSNKIPIAIVANSQGKHTQSIIDAFSNSKSFNVKNVSRTREYPKELMQENKIKTIIILPKNLEKDLSKYQPKIQILTDGSELNVAGLSAKYASGLWHLWLEQNHFIKGSKIQIDIRYWFNSPLLSSYFLLPGSIAIILTLIGTLLTALVVAREWERGTMEALMSTPVSIAEILLAKLLPYFVLALMSMVICMILSLFWFKIPFHGSYLLLLLSSCVYLFPALSIGLLISTLAKNQFIAAQGALISGFLPAMLLSGFIFPISAMPIWLQYFTAIIPARYFIPILQTLFLSGNVYGIILPNLLYMFILGLVVFGIIIKITKKKLA